jgi:hypothetical protein
MQDQDFSDASAAIERRPSNRRYLTIALIGAAALGGAAALWAADRWGWVDFGASRADPEPAALTAPPPAAAPTAAGIESAQTALGVRMAELEQRMTKLNLQADAASGNAARAEGLLIASAARRSVERGAELGYLADQLKLRFGDAQPNAVQTLLDVSARPVTLDTLQQGLSALEPTLVAAPRTGDAIARLGEELSRLFVIRRVSAPSPAPERRLERARLFLETGRVDSAIGEVERMPGRAAAREWLTLARRYVRAQRALDLIETTAILEPGGLGAPVPPASAANPPRG